MVRNCFCELTISFALIAALLCSLRAVGAEPSATSSHAINTWTKQSPLADEPVSPRLGYEGACVWDSRNQLLVRYGGHNQGGGGEQGAEVWTFDPRTAKWTLKQPNTSPPGVCCNKQNAYDPTIGRYIRFPKFSGSHGWQWWREIYLNDSSVWTYDLANNRWRNMRPLPAPRMAPYRCAAWDSDEQVVVVFGGEGGAMVLSSTIPGETSGVGPSPKSNRPTAAAAVWPTTRREKSTSCLARSSKTIRTPGPTA